MLLLLDTNVLSAMMSAEPVRRVVDWMHGQPSETLFTATACQAEILAGIALLPNGRRRAGLAGAAEAMFREDFQGRIWPFDSQAAAAYAVLFAEHRKAGRSVGGFDLVIAAIARTHGASVVTRNVGDFEGVGLTVINPWDHAPA